MVLDNFSLDRMLGNSVVDFASHVAEYRVAYGLGAALLAAVLYVALGGEVPEL